MFRFEPPTLVTVRFCAALVVPTTCPEKLSEPGVMLTAGPLGDVPLPVRVALCGLPAALSETDSVPPRVPVVVGVKVTLIVQLPPAATELPQLLVWPKSPLALMLVMLSGAPPVLLRVTGCEALVVATC